METPVRSTQARIARSWHAAAGAFVLVAVFAGTAPGLTAGPIVIAHRGASGYLPEHTIAAAAMAHAMGADYVEQDLVLSKDNVPVVLHDIHLDTVTDVAQRFPRRKRGDGRYYVLDFTLAELKQLQVKERTSPVTGRQVYPRRYPSGTAPSSFRIATFEEALQVVQGLNRSTGRNVGVYPELKKPKWHRDQGYDISRAVLPILARYGYRNKDDRCYLQCFELTEVRRLRNELGWQGSLVMLVGPRSKGDDGTDYDFLCTPDGMKELARMVDGVGPAISRIVTWTSGATRRLTEFVALANAEGLVVHPYTVRSDDLPGNCPSVDDLHAALFRDARVDGVFTDFPDVTAAWIARNFQRTGER
jgi:glycerophosphoryl diester phosphodiesterase